MWRHPAENQLLLLRVSETVLLLRGHFRHLSETYLTLNQHRTGFCTVLFHYCHVAVRHCKAQLVYKD